MKKRVFSYLLMGMMLLNLCGCEQKNISNNKKEETQPQKIEVKEKNFEFVDVYGNSYQAPLQDKLKKQTYDLAGIKDEEGKKFYIDKEGNQASKFGIDVSEYQSYVDWQKVKASGVQFVMVRLGYRGYGEAGTLVGDKLYRTHIEDALDAGLEVGVYFFSQAINKEEALEEAEFVLERIKDYPITCPVVFDTEEIKFDTARTDSLTAKEFTDMCIWFCERVEEEGYTPLIYANMKWMAFTLELERLESYGKWYADYEALPQCPYEFTMWQYTETGKIDGIEGNVDLNIWFQ